jgi:hypothetical protein
LVKFDVVLSSSVETLCSTRIVHKKRMNDEEVVRCLVSIYLNEDCRFYLVLEPN